MIDQEIVKEFVDIYEKHGAFIAGMYAAGEIEQEEWPEYTQPIRDEFIKRGYEFPNEDVNNVLASSK